MPVYLPMVFSHTAALKNLFARRAMVFGMAGEATSFDSSVQYPLIKFHAGSMTPECYMKMYMTQATQDIWNFCAADSLVERCQADGISVHGHCAMWHLQNPDWLIPALEAASYDERQNILYKHIRALVLHYKDKLSGLDLVNEYGAVFNDIGWGAYLGDDCVPFAFNTARQFSDGLPLYYNSFYASEEDVDFAISLLPLVDGIGIQLHLEVGEDLEARFTRLRRLIDACKAANKPVRFSECTVLKTPDGTLEDVAYLWSRIVRFAMEYPFTVTALTQWGVKYPAWGYRHVLFDSEGKPTLAYYAVVAELEG